MALLMSRPFKHPKTGIYWLRKRVPEDLRGLVGKREELRSLGTREPEEAKRLFAQALADLELRWANLRAGPRSLSECEAHEIANSVYDQITGTYRDNPSDYKGWRIQLFDRLWPESPMVLLSTIENDLGTVSIFERLASEASGRPESLDLLAARIQWECSREAEQLLLDQGLVVNGAGQLRLTKAFAAAKQRATLHLQGLAKNGFGNHVTPARPIVPRDAIQAKCIQPCIPGSQIVTNRSDTPSAATGGAAAARSCAATSSTGPGSPPATIAALPPFSPPSPSLPPSYSGSID